MIPYSRQTIDRKDLDNVKKVLLSDFLTQGPEVKKFEKDVKNYLQVKYALALNSATSALHVACLALKLKKGDWLWTVPNTFTASANCGRFCGANVDFVDINNKTFNICLKKLETKLKAAKKNKKLPKILVVVHLGGNPSDLLEISKLSKKYKFKIIEDASHALGSKYMNSKIGNGKYSSVCVFSLHPVKPITSGEGGLAVTNDKKIFEKMKMYGNHGITKTHKNFKNKIKSHWYYEQQLLGFNYRMSDIHASLARSQLKKLNKFIQTRNKIAKLYKKEFKNLPLFFQNINKKSLSSYHLFIIYLNKSILRKNYNFYFNQLRKEKLGVNLHYLPLHKHPYYKGQKKYEDLSNSEEYSQSAISIPIFNKFDKQKIFHVIRILKRVFC